MQIKSFVLFLSLLYVHGLSAQTTTIIPDRITCRTCRIEAVPFAVLGSPADSASLDHHASIVIKRDRIYASAVAFRGPVAVYDRVGKQIGQIGRAGKGPGEFSSLAILRSGFGDTIYVFDQLNRRYSTMLTSGKYISSHSFRGDLHDVVYLTGGVFVLQSNIRNRDFVAVPLQIVRKDSVLAAFDGPDSEYIVSDVFTLGRVLSRGLDANSFWAARMNRYELQMWSAGPRLHSVVSRRASWFKPWDGNAGNPFEKRTSPILNGIWVDQNRRVWTMTMVPDRRWAKSNYVSGTERRISADERKKLYDTIVEVIDVEKGVVLARQRFEHPLLRVDPTPYVFTTQETADGDVQVAIYNLRLRMK